MSRLIEKETSSTEQFILPCDCMDGDYVRISWDNDSEDRFLWLENLHQAPRFRNRIAHALQALRGWPVSSGEILLSQETVRSLVKYLDEKSSAPSST